MRTSSLLTILLLASLSCTLFAQDCNNPLLNTFGLTGFDEPQSGADLPYCQNLQAAETCCSADTVASFQDRTNIIIDKLNNYAAAKDLYLAQLRNSYYNRYDDLLDDINNNHNDDVQRIGQTDAVLANQLQGDVDSFNQIRTEAGDINRDFVTAMDDYQTARTNCLTIALEVHASSWCLACDPNYASQGVTNEGSVTFSDGLCGAISDACRPYFNEGARFNPLIRAREAYWRLLAVSRYLKDYSDNEQITPFEVSPDPYAPLSTQQAVVVPDETSGSGQCTDLWSGDVLLAELLSIGIPSSPAAETDNNENVEPAVAEEAIIDNTNSDPQVIVVNADGTVVDPNAGRLLQDILAGDEGIWAPAFKETGLNFDALRTDPGTFFGARDYSDDGNQTQIIINATDRTDGDGTDNNDLTGN